MLCGDISGIGCTVNYNHWGAPKRWYGIPSAAAHAFEDVFRTAMPEQFERHPDLLFHLTAMLSPRTLLDHQVPVFAVLQASNPSWPLKVPILQSCRRGSPHGP